MRKITIITAVIILLTACKKDINEIPSGTFAQADLTSKANAEATRVTRPMKIDFHSAADAASPTLSCTLPGIPFAIANSGYFLHGSATHLGAIDAVTSIGQDGFCNLNAEFILTTRTSGQIVAANGDKITYTGDDAIDLNNVILNGGTTAAITGLWTITGGTGKFANASGSFQINGIVDLTATGGPAFSVTGEGTITY